MQVCTPPTIAELLGKGISGLLRMYIGTLGDIGWFMQGHHGSRAKTVGLVKEHLSALHRGSGGDTSAAIIWPCQHQHPGTAIPREPGPLLHAPQRGSRGFTFHSIAL